MRAIEAMLNASVTVAGPGYCFKSFYAVPRVAVERTLVAMPLPMVLRRARDTKPTVLQPARSPRRPPLTSAYAFRGVSSAFAVRYASVGAGTGGRGIRTHCR